MDIDWVAKEGGLDVQPVGSGLGREHLAYGWQGERVQNQAGLVLRP